MAVGNTTLCTFEGTNTTVTCFDNSDAGVQKIRQCGENETLFAVLLLAVVVVFNLASLLATLRLNRIIDYVELYKTSKNFLGCQTQPILHRAAVFQLVESETKEDTETFDEIFQEGRNLSNFINRPKLTKYINSLTYDAKDGISSKWVISEMIQVKISK